MDSEADGRLQDTPVKQTFISSSDIGTRLLGPTLLAVGLCVAASAVAEDEDALPLGFQQIVPRGHIVSVDEPRFVSASEARLPPEAWVFGVVVDGQARAYSLNLLNRHEVVNDAVGDKTFAAVW
jgi:hypothetical protein